MRVHEKSLTRQKDQLKALISRKRSGSVERILKELTPLIIGRIGYYSIADMKKNLTNLAEWLRSGYGRCTGSECGRELRTIFS
ncbi:MAG: hypothetical protein LBE17_06365 [Treponema sp.]|nr:hypothetical protein [Treponema sp.]